MRWSRHDISRGPIIVAVVAGSTVWAAGVFGAYGWFTDELYFLACARRPALGHVDHPPLATLLLSVLRVAGEDSLALIRLVPAVAYGAAIALVGSLARRLDGGAFAQTLAAALFAAAPAVLVIAGFYSMNPFELLFAIALAHVALALTRGAHPRAWVGFGAIAGLALLNKHSTLLPAGLLALALLASPARVQLATRWPYLGVAVAAIVASPNLIWLAGHDGVTLAFYRASIPLKNIEQAPLEAVVGQAMFVGPMAFAIAVIGALALAAQPARRGFAAMFALALAFMMLSGLSRADRILATYPILFAAGACAVERVTRDRPWRAAALVGALAVGALPPLPLVLPLLPPELLVRYSAALAVTPQLEVAKRGAMPQWLGDRRGWRELVDATVAVYRTLPADEQRRTVVFGADYGMAGALDLWGPASGLPAPVISTHNELWARGPGPARDAVVLAVGHDATYWESLYARVQRAGTVRCTGCLIEGTAIWIARGDRPGLAARWPELRRFE